LELENNSRTIYLKSNSVNVVQLRRENMIILLTRYLSMTTAKSINSHGKHAIADMPKSLCRFSRIKKINVYTTRAN